MVDYTERNNARADLIARFGWFSILAGTTNLEKCISGHDNGKGARNLDICPKCGEPDFYLLKGADEHGCGRCWKCFAKGVGDENGKKSWDGFRVVELANGLSFPDAVKMVEGYIGFEWNGKKAKATKPIKRIEPKVTAISPEEEQRRIEWKRGMINDLCKGAVEFGAPGSEVGLMYLANRGIKSFSSVSPNNLFLHPSVPYIVTFEKPRDGKLSSDDAEIFECCKQSGVMEKIDYHDPKTKVLPKRIHMGSYPCILQLVRCSQAFSGYSIQRIYLTQQGQKLRFEPHHKGLGSKLQLSIPHEGGGANYLDPPTEIMAIAEGFETLASVRPYTDASCACTINANGIIAFCPPRGVKVVLVLEDKDRSETGERATDALRERLAPQGIVVVRVAIQVPIPPSARKGIDWLDVMNSHGVSQLPQYFTNTSSVKDWSVYANN
ncbi:toprim domain-containing protein [Vibrio breoganii]|uniref:toprim domain-containing protein n=1 Tax=Vibrio breoganii TaxID=553239 RepID=UPI000C846923|nr:toprim domain-containing protein [Vibrio breoganii]PML12720.1 hypothetical protein BCT84_02225 [Vibrio breoganii]